MVGDTEENRAHGSFSGCSFKDEMKLHLHNIVMLFHLLFRNYTCVVQIVKLYKLFFFNKVSLCEA